MLSVQSKQELLQVKAVLFYDEDLCKTRKQTG